MGKPLAPTALSLAAVAVVLFLGDTGSAGRTQPAERAGDPARGGLVWMTSGCGACHAFSKAGSTGTKSSEAPNLDRYLVPHARRVKLAVELFAFSRIYWGGRGMPAHGWALSTQEIDDLVSFLVGKPFSAPPEGVARVPPLPVPPPVAAVPATTVARWVKLERLLEHFAIETTAVPDEIVTELPRIKIERERGLPVSGSAHWNGRYWVITLSADEHRFRQRFSLMHEFKHVIDHTTKDFLHEGRPTSSAYEQAERVADYFAACLLMPKRVVKRLWCQGHQDIANLADLLQVSPAALRYRLDQLGLTDRPTRCESAKHAYASRPVARARVPRPALAGDSR